MIEIKLKIKTERCTLTACSALSDSWKKVKSQLCLWRTRPVFWNHTAVSLTAFRRLQGILHDCQNHGKCTIKTVINSRLLKCCCRDIRAISTWYNLKACRATCTLHFSTFTAKIVSKEAEVPADPWDYRSSKKDFCYWVTKQTDGAFKTVTEQQITNGNHNSEA